MSSRNVLSRDTDKRKSPMNIRQFDEKEPQKPSYGFEQVETANSV